VIDRLKAVHRAGWLGLLLWLVAWGQTALPAASGDLPDALSQAIGSGDWTQALQAVLQIQKTNPDIYRDEHLYLLQGWLHEQAGQTGPAAAVYDRWLDREPFFQDYLRMELARLLAESGAGADSRRHLFAVVKSVPTSPYAEEAHLQLAASYAADGKTALALKTYQAFAQKYKARRQETQLKMARLHLQLGERAQAWTLLQTLLKAKGARTQSEAAAIVLDQPALMATIRRTETALAGLAGILLESREAGRCLPLVQELLARFPDSAQRPRYLYWQGRCFFLQGNYTRAVAMYTQAAGLAEPELRRSCQFSAARALLLDRKETQALPIYARLLGEMTTAQARSEVFLTLYNASRLAGDAAATRGWLDRAIAELPDGYGRDFRFRGAVALLQQGAGADAASILEDLAPQLPADPGGNRPGRHEALYFLGLARHRLGQPEAALRAWTSAPYSRHNHYNLLAMESARALLQAKPTLAQPLCRESGLAFREALAQGREADAYEELGRQFLLTGDLDSWRAGVVELEKLSGRLADLVSPALLPVGGLLPPQEKSLSSPQAAFYRARVFQRLGLAEAAAAEYGRLKTDTLARLAGLAPSELAIRRAYTLAVLGERAGLPNQAYRWAAQYLDRYPPSTPFALLQPEMARLCYPAPFQDSVLPLCRQYGLDPLLVYGIIHQESRFNARAHSAVSARGLMQLMPETAQAVAAANGIALPPDSRALYQPALNIRLGVLYLRQLLDFFKEPVACVAAYNAGQSQADFWRRLAAAPAEWYLPLEVHFDQTHHYVQQVLANRRLYAEFHPELLLPAEADNRPPARGRYSVE